MKKKAIFGILALLVVGLIATTSLVSAFGNGFPGRGMPDEGMEEIARALESGDFESWKDLMQKRITEENFNKLRERHQSMLENKIQKEDSKRGKYAGSK